MRWSSVQSVIRFYIILDFKLDRVVDERAYWKQTEQQRLDGIVNEKAVAAAKSKKTMEQKFKEYDKTIFWDEKEFGAYWKAREKLVALRG